MTGHGQFERNGEQVFRGELDREAIWHVWERDRVAIGHILRRFGKRVAEFAQKPISQIQTGS
jgi:hypothetical protein